MTSTSRPGSGPFGSLEFTLVLLRRMADHQPGLVEDALRELGVGKAEMREANRVWQARGHARGARPGVQRYRSALGPPEGVLPRRIGDLDCEALRWRLPLWPDLRFEVVTGPGGQVWNEWLVRAPGAPGPELHALADLHPWCCTIDEVARAFPPATPMEGTAPTRWRLAFTAPGAKASDERRGHVAEFTWGLLQRLDP
ncbi:hypothetical protein [Streptomyces sp. NPDC048639]|uniref:hypothetical protein n=1 Tax=Streptomyces sp. NPDC048639 TaxID=3365581 RepID=UPI00371ABF86